MSAGSDSIKRSPKSVVKICATQWSLSTEKIEHDARNILPEIFWMTSMPLVRKTYSVSSFKSVSDLTVVACWKSCSHQIASAVLMRSILREALTRLALQGLWQTDHQTRKRSFSDVAFPSILWGGTCFELQLSNWPVRLMYHQYPDD